MGHSQWVGLQVNLIMASLYVLYVGLCLLVSPGSSQLCPTYEAGFTGQNMDSRLYPTVGTLYMNFEERSSCAGTVYGWHYCFDPDNGSPPRGIVLAMYSQREDNSYQLVLGSYYELRVNEEVESFTCRNITLEPSEYFSVQEGDVVAICREIEVEEVVELYFELQGHDLWYWQPGSCSETTIEFPNSNFFRIRDNRVMLLSAYININECELGVDTCNENATCSDVVGDAGSFSCTCNPGYTGNGTTCVETKFEETEFEEDNFPLLLIIVVVIVVMAPLVVITTIIIGILCYKMRKQKRTSAKQEIEIPEYAEISPDSKETSNTEPIEQSSSQQATIEMQRNMVYGVGNQLATAQSHGGEGREYEVIQPQSSGPTASHAMMFRLNVAYGVTGQRM